MKLKVSFRLGLSRQFNLIIYERYAAWNKTRKIQNTKKEYSFNKKKYHSREFPIHSIKLSIRMI
ncbi:MAG: hypothetical protein ACLSG8_07950 [Barnesiella sp.]